MERRAVVGDDALDRRAQPMLLVRCMRSPVMRCPTLSKRPKLLDVDVQQFAWHLALVALNGLIGPQIVQPGQACALQHATDGGLGDTGVLGNPSL